MSVDNGKIIAPIDWGDPYEVMGIARPNTGYEVTDACTSDRINPASKHKPIRRDTYKELTKEERRTIPADMVQGIYYGVKIGLQGHTLSDLHDSKCEYIRVRENEDWSRITDFVGYDHNAKYNPQGELPDSVYTDIDSGFTVNVLYDNNNTTGVDVREVMGVELSAMYPCIMISDISRGENWVRALANTDKSGLQGYVFTPIEYEGATYLNFTAPINDYESTDGGNESLAQNPKDFLTTEAERVVTVFFVKQLYNAVMGWDLRKWHMYSADVLPIFNPFACPEATGKIVTFARYYTKGVGVTSIALMVKSNKVYVLCAYEWIDPIPDTSYSIFVSIYKDGERYVDSGATVTYSNEPGESVIQMVEMETEILVMSPDQLSGDYEYIWYVMLPSLNKKVNSGSGTFIQG